MARLIKRYGNRKMYDSEASRYVTLDRVTELVRAGEDLRIIDNDSGADLTAVTFAQIIFEEEKRKNGLLELPAMRWIIQQGGATVQEILSRVDKGREAIENVREMAEERMRHVRDLMQGGEPRPADGEDKTTPHGKTTAGGKSAQGKAAHDRAGGDAPQGLRALAELMEAPQRQLEQLQHRIDSQVRASIERLTHHPTLRKELRRIEDNLKGLERQLTKLSGRQERPPKARRPKKKL